MSNELPGTVQRLFGSMLAFRISDMCSIPEQALFHNESINHLFSIHNCKTKNAKLLEFAHA